MDERPGEPGPATDGPPPVDEAADEGTEAAAARPPGGRARRLLSRLARVLVVLVAVALGAALVVGIWLVRSFPSLSRDLVLDEAARRGLRIEPRDVEVRWGEVVLRDTPMELDGVPDLELAVEWIRVRLDGLAPVAIEARGVRARARSLDAAAQLLAFGRGRAGDLPPATATELELSLSRAGGAGEPVVEVRAAAGALTPGAPATLSRALVTSRGPELRLGPVDLLAVARGATLELGVGPSLAGSPVRVLADLDARTAEIDLPRVAAPALAQLLGRAPVPSAPPWPGAFDVEARVQLAWPRDPREAVSGTAEATLFGLVPPHPAELSGIVFGKDTRVGLRFRATPTDEAIALDALTVKVGAIAISGTGSVAPRGDSFDARASLRGPIACADLVGSAAVARLGLPIGAGVGALARQGLAGTVDLRLEVLVRGERVDAPEVRPTATIHCRLRLFGG